MQISITEKEVNAIDFGLEQIRDALEGSSSEEYKQDAEEAMRSLGNILRKCHLAREKAMFSPFLGFEAFVFELPLLGRAAFRLQGQAEGRL